MNEGGSDGGLSIYELPSICLVFCYFSLSHFAPLSPERELIDFEWKLSVGKNGLEPSLKGHHLKETWFYGRSTGEFATMQMIYIVELFTIIAISTRSRELKFELDLGSRNLKEPGMN